MKSSSISAAKAFLILAISFTFSAQVVVASTIEVVISTGGDDLRGNGNGAYITVNFADGTASPEYALGGGFANNTTITKTINLVPTITDLNQIKNIVMRHKGNPRPGFPADSYDKWDLKALQISVVINGAKQILINESGNPLVRFTDKLRSRIFTPKGVQPKTSTLKVFLNTGSDDLRGGNNAYMTVNYTNGTTSNEFDLGGGFGQNSVRTIPVNLGKELTTISEIKSITIRHNGNPRSGNPFDSYENWDLQSIRAALIYPDGVERNVINLSGNPLVRYTGDMRTKTWPRG